MSVSDQLRLSTVSTLSATRALDEAGAIRQASSGKGERRQLQEVSKQFEALLIKTMLKQARSTQNGNALFNDPRNGVYGDLYDEQIAQQLAVTGKLGFADLIYRNLAPSEVLEADTAARSARVLDPPVRNPWLRAVGGSTPRASNDAAADARPSNPMLTSAVANRHVEAVTANGQASTERADVSTTMDASRSRGYLWDSPEAFIDELWPAAREAAKQIGTAPQAVLAVAALETGWGRHVPPRNDGGSSNNLFGIKARGDADQPRTYASTLEFEQGGFKRKVEPFRAYETPAQAVVDFARLVATSPRYAKARNTDGDPVAFVRALHQAGYATDPNYSGKLERVLASSQMRAAVTRNTVL